MSKSLEDGVGSLAVELAEVLMRSPPDVGAMALISVLIPVLVQCGFSKERGLAMLDDIWDEIEPSFKAHRDRKNN